jgi:hypothetical protein
MSTLTLECANWSGPLHITVSAAAMQGVSATVVVPIPNDTKISPKWPTLNATLATVPLPLYRGNGCSGTRVAASFTFNSSGSVVIVIHGDSAYRIAEDEVCEAAVPLAELERCAPSDPNATAILAIFRVIVLPPQSPLQSAVAATTTAISVVLSVASSLCGRRPR